MAKSRSGATSTASGGGGGGGAFGGHGSLGGLIQAGQANSGNWAVNYDPNKRGDYDNNGNPNVLKYQQQDDDKTANYLAGADKNIDLNNDPQYADGYSYHDLPLNRQLARLQINNGATVLSEADFQKYVQQTGASVVYRGWSSSASADRFLNTTNNHVGNGVMGDGYYFSPDLSVARTYAGYGSGNITKMALSPSARVIDLQTLRTMMLRASSKLQNSLRRSGTGGSGRTYGANVGESQYALKMGYNVIQNGNYLVGITSDAFVVSTKKI